MISVLQGTLDEPEADGATVVMTASGLGYQVYLNDRDRGVLNAKGKGAEVKVFVRHIVTETASRMYGFLDWNERVAFDKLLKLDGVGPATAVRLLSVFPIAALRTTLVSGDKAALLKVSGVGEKTAKRLIDEAKV